MPRTSDRRYGPQIEEDRVIFKDRGADPSDEGAVWNKGGSLFGLDSVGVFNLRTGAGGVTIEDEGTGIPNNPYTVLNFEGAGVTVVEDPAGTAKVTIPGGDDDDSGARAGNLYPATMLAEPGVQVVVDDYPALEFPALLSRYAWGTQYWKGGSPTSVEIRAKVVLKKPGPTTGTNVRIAAKVKAKATGENIKGAFDVETVNDLTVNHTTDGDIFETTLTLSGTNFADSDAVVFAVGRDANDEVTGGSADDVGAAIHIIATDVRIIP